MKKTETPAPNDRMFDCLSTVGDPMVESTTPPLHSENKLLVVQLVDKIQQKKNEEKIKLDKEKF